MSERIRRMCSGLLVVSLALLPSLSVARAPQQEQPDLAALTQRVEGLLDLIEDAADLIPAETLDPIELAASLGTDQQAHLEWVRDNTDWVPYQGALRGPEGVLMDRLGNSLDRSLLLAGMLEAQGLSVRLARAELSDAAAETLMGQVRAPASRGPASVVASPEYADRFWQLVGDLGLDATELRESEAASAQRQADAQSQAATRVDEQAAILNAAIASIRSVADETEATTAAARDHWWVQTRIDRNWIDLDPMLPDAAVGDVHSDSPETVTFRKRNGALVLPRDTAHEVTFRVIVEQSRNGRLREREALEHVFRPIDLAGDPVSFTAYAIHAPADFNTEPTADLMAELRRRAARPGEWLPILRIGSELVYTNAFTADGGVKRPDLSLLGGSQRQLSGALAQLGALDAAVSGGSADPMTFASAAWLEYEVSVPGSDTKVIRRPLFDLLGAARGGDSAPTSIDDDQRVAREAALIGWSDLLVLGADLPRDFVERRAASGFLAGRDTILEIMRAASRERYEEILEEAGSPEGVPLQLYSLAVARSEWAGGTRTYMRRPNILTTHRGYRLGTDGTLSFEQRFDIVANDVTSAGDAFDARLRQGVLDTNAEALLLAVDGPVANTAELMAADADSGRNWVLITDLAAAPWSASGAGARMRQLVGADLAAGYAVVAPPTVDNEEDVAWWRIDPATGDTLGMMANGGQAATERIILAIRIPFCVLPALLGSLSGTAVCAYVAFTGASGLSWFAGTAWAAAVEYIAVVAFIRL
ncbi:MAG: hypothetical protein QF664_03775 [Dehalococcoidia bacterium]|nr:hypothetical protein [Dehalococcoidia bacterium]